MLISQRPQPWGAPALALLAALAIHAALLWGMRPLLEQDEPVDPPTPKETRVVMRQLTDEQQARLFKPRPKPEPKKPEPERPPEPPKPEEAQPVVEPMQERKVVIQETNEEVPVDPKYLSPEANKTEEETRATETTLKNVEPGPPDPNVKEDATKPDPAHDSKDEDPNKEVAVKPSDPVASRVEPPKRAPDQRQKKPSEVKPREDDTKREITKDGPGDKKPSPDEASPKPEATPDPAEEGVGKVDPRKLFPTMNDYDKVFGDTHAEHAEAAEAAAAGKRKRRSFANMGERQRNLRASLENMITEVKPGNHTSVNAAPAIYAGYMAAMHRRIHQRWPDYLISLDMQYPAGHPLQKATLQVTLEYVIEAKTGTFKAVNIVNSSGQMMFDAEAIDTAWSLGKQPNAPKQIISPDGNIYIHWNFWRDGRQCGLFGAAIYIVHRDAAGNPLPFKADDPDKARPLDTRGMHD